MSDFGYGNIIEAEESNNIGQKSVNEIQYSESKSLKLSFLEPVRDLVYTGIAIGGGAFPDIALRDIPTGNIVKSGSEASAKVGLFVLNRSFSKEDADNWTSEEFEQSILPGRHGKASLLGKSTHIHLSEGLGSLKDVFFSHTRNPLPKIYVRLGARVVDSSGGIRIREAVSNTFVVKDRRGRNKKDRPISCNDEVWRLENIGKDGPSHKKLRKENINTVKDLLAMCKEDPGKLHNILEETMTPSKLEATINHAKKCEDNSPASEQNEAKHVNATGMISNAHKDEVSAMPVAAFKNTGEDWDDGSSSNPIFVFDSDGNMIIDSAEFGQLFNMPEPESTTGGFMEEEHQWHLPDNIIIRDENEHEQYFDLPFDLPQSTMFSPPADLCSETQRSLVCDVPHGRVHIRWKLLRSILRWLSIRRIVARKLEVIQGHEGPFFQNNLNATNASKALQVG